MPFSANAGAFFSFLLADRGQPLWRRGGFFASVTILLWLWMLPAAASRAAELHIALEGEAGKGEIHLQLLALSPDRGIAPDQPVLELSGRPDAYGVAYFVLRGMADGLYLFGGFQNHNGNGLLDSNHDGQPLEPVTHSRPLLTGGRLDPAAEFILALRPDDIRKLRFQLNSARQAAPRPQ